jgi:hypothetical protein
MVFLENSGNFAYCLSPNEAYAGSKVDFLNDVEIFEKFLIFESGDPEFLKLNRIQLD